MLALGLSSCGGGDGAFVGAAEVDVDTSITSDRCVVTIGYVGERDVDLAEVRLDYTGVAGNFGEPGYAARCRSLVDVATRNTFFNTCDGDCAQGETRSLHLSFSVGQANDDLVMHAPASMFECYFEGDGATLEQLTGEMRLYDSLLSEYVASFDVAVECDGWPDSTTTTTSTTTSTQPCDGDGCEEGSVIPLQFWLDDAIALGSVQFTVNFPAAIGEFDQFDSSSIHCTLGAGINALYASVQDPSAEGSDSREARVGLVFVPVTTGPRQLLTCDFVVGDEAPSIEDFSITVVDAGDISAQPVIPFPALSIRGVPAGE